MQALQHQLEAQTEAREEVKMLREDDWVKMLREDDWVMSGSERQSKYAWQ